MSKLGRNHYREDLVTLSVEILILWYITPNVSHHIIVKIHSLSASVTGSVHLWNMQAFSGSLQYLKPQDDQDGIHAGFAQLLSEFNKPYALYTISLANRLYGEQSYQFVEVCVCSCVCVVKACLYLHNSINRWGSQLQPYNLVIWIIYLAKWP